MNFELRQPRRRLGIAGIHIESSTFSPLPSRKADFAATRGPEMLARYPFLAEPEFASIEPVPLAHFRALPGGAVAAADYAEMRQEIMERLDAAGPLDGFFLDVHGAMSVAGLDDAELDLAAALRARLGPEVPLTCCQDLHGNVSPEFMAQVNFLTTYRTAPHLDVGETRERAVRMMSRWWRERCPVFRARVGIPVLVSGEMSSTTNEPGRRLYAPLAAESARPGIWDASLWVGYAWADQPRAMASAVVTGTERSAVANLAEEIAQRYWEARAEFSFLVPSGSPVWCLDAALARGARAIFLSDAGDNPTAGAAGDVTETLAALLAHPKFFTAASAIFASIPDASAVRACATAGRGQEVSVELGGKLDPIHGVPLPVSGTVITVREGDPMGGAEAVLRAGNVHIIVTEKRKPFHKRSDFLALGLDPLEHEVTVVKIGYLEPELAAMAHGHFLVLSAGGVPPDVAALPYRHLQRPMFPADREFDWRPRAQVWAFTGGSSF